MAQIKTIYGNEVIDDALRGSVANEYSSSSTYAVGDMVLKEGQLYECNTAISTAEAWTAAHWTAVTVGGEIATVKDGLSDVEAQVTAALVTDTASGSIASFPDGADGVPVKSLTVAIEPVQDLHGQANPYPAGGGKNILDASKIVFANYESDTTRNGITLTKNSDGSFKLSGTATAETRLTFKPDMTLAGGSYTLSITGGTGSTLRFISNGNNGLAYTSALLNGTFTKTYTVTDNAVYQYMYLDVQNGATVNSTIYVQLEKGSTATAWSPYENICPISGHTSAVVTRTGKNLFDKDNAQMLNAYINGSGVILRSNPDRLVYVRIKPNTVYSVTFTQKALTASAYADDCQIGFYASTPTLEMTGTRIYSQSRTSATADYTYTYTGNSGTNSWIALKVGNNERTDITASLATLQIEEGSATAYEPYTADTYTIDLDGTRYGGTLDVGTGVLTVDRAIVSITSVQGKANTSVNKEYYFTGVQNAIDATKSIISDKYPYNANPNVIYNTNIKAIGVADNGIILLGLGADGPSDMASANTFLSNNPITVCYFLKTPQTVQLTGQDITTVYGQNNIWADTGDVEVEYRADTKLYIQKVINS